MNERFKKDLYRFYELIGESQKKLGNYYGLIENKNYKNEELKRYVTEFLNECDLKYNK
ncbi:MAG: hypothetical protein L3J44_04250 [Campylobacteraceae bacterium]|nr:hypothetical protein [Campylobacteraceae bacterium]